MMILYLDSTTNIPDVYIDYIMVKLKNGQEVSLNWDESDISRNENGFGARYKGVYFGEEYANGRLDELQGMEITDIGLYFESTGTFHFKIDEMTFDDNGHELSFQNPAIPANCSGMESLLTTQSAEHDNEQKGSPLKQITVTLNVDEGTILKESGQDNLDDAISQELGWLNDSGMFVENWSYATPTQEKDQRPSISSFESVIQSASARAAESQSTPCETAKEPDPER